MKADFRRRDVILGGMQIALDVLLAPLTSCGVSSHSPGSSGPFDKRSTAEEVSAALDLRGKRVLITGCNSGIGHEMLRVLVLRGAEVLAVARTLEKAAGACASVQLPAAQGHATPFACEQTNLNSVIACSNAIRDLGDPLDVLICNAGVNLPDLEVVNGYEKNFLVNHLSHFLLVNRVLPQLTAATQGRVVVIGSFAYLYAPAAGVELDNLSGQKRPYTPTELYGQSKLANGLFARELARRVKDTRVTANVVHPGVVDTKMNRNWNGNMPSYWHLYGWLLGHTFKMKTVAQGAATPCFVATNPSLAKVSGAYFEDCHVAIPGGRMRDDALAERLWLASEAILEPYLKAP